MNKIIWEKWNDPFGENLDEAKWNNYDDEDSDESASILEDEYLKSKLSKPVKVIASPLGIIPYNEHTASSKIFNFWIGHTNFSISQSVTDVIEDCDGVEILDVFTRYRFRIAIGKCFADSEVMQIVESAVITYLSKND
jgi:hypothetical protein